MGEAKYAVGIGLAGDVEKLERGLGQAMTRIGLVRYRPVMQQHHEPPLGSQHARQLREADFERIQSWIEFTATTPSALSSAIGMDSAPHVWTSTVTETCWRRRFVRSTMTALGSIATIRRTGERIGRRRVFLMARW